MGYNPWGHKELDRTEELCLHAHTHISIVYICQFQSPNMTQPEMGI